MSAERTRDYVAELFANVVMHVLHDLPAGRGSAAAFQQRLAALGVLCVRGAADMAADKPAALGVLITSLREMQPVDVMPLIRAAAMMHVVTHDEQ